MTAPREYDAAWVTPEGATRFLGRYVARFRTDVVRAVTARHPFLPRHTLRVTPVAGDALERPKRGFDDPVTAKQAAALAHTPAASVKRQATRALSRAAAGPPKPLTKGQRFWRDNMRRRKRASPRRASDEG